MKLGKWSIGWWWAPLLSWTAAFTLLLVGVYRPRPERTGEVVRPAGLYNKLSVVERPAVCVYIYSTGSAVGMTTVPKAAQGGAGC